MPLPHTQRLSGMLDHAVLDAHAQGRQHHSHAVPDCLQMTSRTQTGCGPRRTPGPRQMACHPRPRGLSNMSRQAHAIPFMMGAQVCTRTLQGAALQCLAHHHDSNCLKRWPPGRCANAKALQAEAAASLQPVPCGLRRCTAATACMAPCCSPDRWVLPARGCINMTAPLKMVRPGGIKPFCAPACQGCSKGAIPLCVPAGSRLLPLPGPWSRQHLVCLPACLQGRAVFLLLAQSASKYHGHCPAPACQWCTQQYCKLTNCALASAGHTMS